MAPLPDPLEHFEKRRVEYTAPAGANSPQHEREAEYGVLVSSRFDAEKWDKGVADLTNIALLVTTPLGGTAEFLAMWADLLEETAPSGQQDCDEDAASGRAQMKMICVNRPGIGATTAVGGDANDTLNIIVEDIERALQQERVSRFHVLGMCSGAMTVPALVRRFISEPSSAPLSRPRLSFPVFFNAPWSSVENPHTLSIARLGANPSVPSWLVNVVTSVGASFESLGLCSIRATGANVLNFQLNSKEKEAFTEEDLERGGRVFAAIMASKNGADVQGQMKLALAGREINLVESLKGMVKDSARFAREHGLQSVAEVSQNARVQEEAERSSELVDNAPLFKIYSGGDKDNLTSPAAIDWFQQLLCDAAQEVHLDPKKAVHLDRFEDAGHAGILSGNGPMRNPIIFRDVLQRCGA